METTLKDLIEMGNVSRHEARKIAGENGFDASNGYHDDESLILEAIITEPTNWQGELAEYCREIVEYNESQK